MIDINKLLFIDFVLEKFVQKLLGKNDIEDALKRLDTLTMEEARMAIAENLKVTNRVDDKVDKVDGKVDRVDDKVDKVGEEVGNKVDKVNNKVTVLIDGVQKVSLWLCTFLMMDMARCQRSKRAVCEHGE